MPTTMASAAPAASTATARRRPRLRSREEVDGNGRRIRHPPVVRRRSAGHVLNAPMWDESQRWPDGAVKEGKLIWTGRRRGAHVWTVAQGVGQHAGRVQV